MKPPFASLLFLQTLTTFFLYPSNFLPHCCSFPRIYAKQMLSISTNRIKSRSNSFFSSIPESTRKYHFKNSLKYSFVSSAATSPGAINLREQENQKRQEHQQQVLLQHQLSSLSSSSISSTRFSIGKMTSGHQSCRQLYSSSSFSPSSGSSSVNQILDIPSKAEDFIHYFGRLKDKACANVIVVPVLKDNFAYILHDVKTNKATVVDPVEPQKLMKVIREKNLDVEYILCTHHHWDHSGGNIEMAQLLSEYKYGDESNKWQSQMKEEEEEQVQDERRKPMIRVYSSAYEKVEGKTHGLQKGDMIELGSLEIHVLHSPCHTAGHLLFLVKKKNDKKNKYENDDDQILFTGDTLFVGGCGRFFEGNAHQMENNLSYLARNIHPNTLVYCGHEYTNSNLKFAMKIDPQNQALQEFNTYIQKEIQANRHSIPTTIGIEAQLNVFMRTNELKIAEAVLNNQEFTSSSVNVRVGEENEDEEIEDEEITKSFNPVQVMQKLRELKNNS